MNDVVENKDGLYELLGIPETSILCAKPGDTVIVSVDPSNTEEQMFAHGKRVKDALPDYTILVIPNNVYLSSMTKEMLDGVTVGRTMGVSN